LADFIIGTNAAPPDRLIDRGLYCGELCLPVCAERPRALPVPFKAIVFLTAFADGASTTDYSSLEARG
jgi:hypothetical protein